MSDFAFVSDSIALPRGAWAKTHRQRLTWKGRTVLALTQGDFRSYVYPLMTPAGHCVTSERPADHPHHASMWIGSDHVHALMPAAGGTIEEYTYNFYVDEIFQGRAPGRIVETSCEGRDLGDGRFEIAQELEWRGPVEWAAAAGRIIARERRVTTVEPGDKRHRIDVASQISSGEWALRLGPTRHAYFNVRVADSMIVANGGTVRDQAGREGGDTVSGEGARWIDFTGDVSGGARAGITVIPHGLPDRAPFWFAADWGVITVGPFRSRPLELSQGERFVSRNTVLVHDGEADEEEAGEIAGARGDLS